MEGPNISALTGSSPSKDNIPASNSIPDGDGYASFVSTAPLTLVSAGTGPEAGARAGTAAAGGSAGCGATLAARTTTERKPSAPVSTGTAEMSGPSKTKSTMSSLSKWDSVMPGRYRLVITNLHVDR